MPAEDYTIDEVCDRGEQIYEEQIKPLVEPQENGKFVVIDVESGDYEIANELPDASQRLRERQPDCVGFGARIGCESAFHMGWRGTYGPFDEEL